MEGREIILCILLLPLVPGVISLHGRCEQSAILSKMFLYKHSFDLCATNKRDTSSRAWCDNHVVKPEIFDCERGRVKLNIPSSQPADQVNSYKIILQYINNTSCSSAQGNFVEHTDHEISITRSNNSTCIDEDMELPFDYITSGCYRLKITPIINRSTSLRACFTHNFTLETDFIMTPIAPPSVSSGYMNQRRGFLTIKDGGGLYLAYSVLVRLKNISSIKPISCCSPDKSRIKGYNKVQTLPECHDYLNGPYMPPQVEDEGCSCYWDIRDPYRSVKCIFNHLDPGNYTVSVIINDPRCMLPNSNCSFYVNLPVYEKNASEIPPTLHPFQSNTAWIWCTAIVLLIIAIVTVIFIYNKYRLRPIYDHIHPSLGLTPIDKTIKILLLYPRDCEPFMKAMESFRTLLKSINHFEVYDALDPAQEDIVSVSTNTWGLNLLTDSSTKVILVASWCSLRFYESLLDKDSIRYIDRRPFDHLFQYHLDHLFERNQQYKKIYVVRLECNNAENLVFEHIAQSRIFTLPQFTEALVNQLLELSPDRTIIFEEESGNEKLVGKLCDAIKNYSQYVDENPNYLNTIIKDNLIIDTQTLDYEC